MQQVVKGEFMPFLGFKQKTGFTLIELLVIVLILGVLTSIALPQYRRSVERARVAEALTLVRSIYDSCERLAWENQKNNCGAAVTAGIAKFPKLDITIKGTYSSTGTALLTDNFTYELGNNITATSVKGSYQGAKIVFNGRNFSCSAPASGEASRACSVWGASTWNE